LVDMPHIIEMYGELVVVDWWITLGFMAGSQPIRPPALGAILRVSEVKRLPLALEQREEL